MGHEFLKSSAVGAASGLLAIFAVLVPAGALAEGGDVSDRVDVPACARNIPEPTDVTPGFCETSEYMIGSVAVGIIFVESDGAIDPDEEDWTDEQKSFALAQIRTALDSWEGQTPARANLRFVTEVESVGISYEPITRTTSFKDQALWVGEAMNKLGYPKDPNAYRTWAHPYVGAVREYVNALRQEKKTDWAYAIFMVNDAKDSDGKFSDGNFAYALLGGPYLVVTYKNDGWTPARMARVIAHETGHIFYATDTYDKVTERSGYYNAPDVDGDGVYSLMHGDDTDTLASDTRLQIGWRDSNGNGILDPIDTTPTVALQTTYAGSLTDQRTLTYQGIATDKPTANQNSQGTGKPVTINRVTGVRFRVDGGEWRDAAAVDGAFDSAVEEFKFFVESASTGKHVVEVTASNSMSHTLTTPARDTVSVTHVVVDQALAQTSYANVGSLQPIRFHLIWAHDASLVTTGSITVDGTPYTVGKDGWVTAFVSSPKAGVFTPRLTQVSSGVIRDFFILSPLPSIEWDRIHATVVHASDSYVGVGTPVTIFVEAEMEASGDPLGPDDSLFIAGQQATWDGLAKAFRVDIQEDSVAKRTVNLTAGLVGKTGITAVDTAPLVGVIWDRVRVTGIAPSRGRTDVGQTESILVRGILEQSGVPLGAGDTVFVNGLPAVWDDASQAFRLDYTADSVGSIAFTVTQVRQASEDVTALALPPSTSVIWDRVHVTLIPHRPRVDVGSTAGLDLRAAYVYDGAELTGDVALNVPLKQDKVGWQDVTVEQVRDSQYGLTQFTSNTVRIVWDALQVTLSPEKPRVEAGRAAAILASARYASDGAPAQVEVTLDKDMRQDSLGPMTFEALRVRDTVNGITTFTGNDAMVIFDRVQATHRSMTAAPGTVVYEGTIQYVTDGSSVQGAMVRLENENPVVGNGQYRVGKASWLPWEDSLIIVQVDGFQPVERRARGLQMGNALAEGGAVIVGMAGLWVLLRRRLGKKD